MEEGGEVTKEKTRIYVGGLGGAVTEDDLRKTFSALGEVVAVDVVRTKGRSFAYLDFLPSSDKSLPKLFSTYNGCMWKGGKLRLEKAKEHYLLRLKREWQEESEIAKKASDSSDASASETHDTIEKPKKPSPADKTQFNIFFPKLGKVKSLGQVGIGKHKYSFQRIQVPSIPTHFCDCEEHAPAFIPSNKKQSCEFENASDGINEQELDIMNSVMNKIFERANPSKKVIGGDVFDNEDDEEDHLTDEDNLIINVAKGNSDEMDLLGEMRMMMANREPIAKREKPKSVDDNLKKKTTVPLSKKRKSPNNEDNNGSDPMIPETSRKSKIRIETQESKEIKTESVKKDNNGCDPMIPETSRKSKIRIDTQESKETKTESAKKKQSDDNSLRTLKSTWKDLIGQKRNTSFNIPGFLASIPQNKEKEDLKGDEIHHPLTKSTNETLKEKNLEDDDNKGSTTEGLVNLPTQETNESEVLPEASKEKEEKDPPVKNQSEVFPIASKEKVEEDPPVKNESEVFPIASMEKVEEDPPVKNDEDLIRTARGESWRHKSSWTQLISTTSHTSFSISQIVPNLSFEKQEQKVDGDTFDSQSENPNLKTSGAPINNEASVKKNNTVEKKTSLYLKNLESEDTCPFMRNEESMKEWKKAKSSLSGANNKKKRAVNESA